MQLTNKQKLPEIDVTEYAQNSLKLNCLLLNYLVTSSLDQPGYFLLVILVIVIYIHSRLEKFSLANCLSEIWQNCNKYLLRLSNLVFQNNGVYYYNLNI